MIVREALPPAPRWVIDELLEQRNAIMLGFYVDREPIDAGECCAVVRAVRVGRRVELITLTEVAGAYVARALEILGWADDEDEALSEWYPYVTAWSDDEGTEERVVAVLDDAIRIAKDGES